MASWIWREPAGPAADISRLVDALGRQRARGAGSRTATIDSISDALAAMGDAAVPALLERLEVVGGPACVALARIGAPAYPAIVGQLHAGSVERRCLLVQTLGLSGLAEAVDPLVAALDDPDPAVRRAAHLALERFAKIWVRRLHDGSRRDEAMRVLVAIGAPAAWPLANTLRDPRLGLFAARALGQIGAPAVEPVMVVFLEARRSLSGDGEPVFSYVAAALADIGAPALDPVLYLLYDRRESTAVRIGAAVALGRMGEVAVPSLIEALQVNDGFVRRCAAGALGDAGDGSAVPYLEAALDDDDGGVRAAAAAALTRLGA